MNTLKGLLDSYIKGEPSAVESMIVPSHLAQMKLFMLRQGVKFFPIQDTPTESRKIWLNKQIHRNRLDLYLPQIVDEMLCTGQILFYLRFDGKGYRLLWFNEHNHRVIYNSDGEISKAICTYSYESEIVPHQAAYSNHRSVRLIITKDSVRYAERVGQNAFALDMMGNASHLMDQRVENEVVVRNSLGVLPCVVVKNHDPGPGQKGRDEFSRMAKQLMTHANLVDDINTNLRFFGSPTLITTRSINELLMMDDPTTRVVPTMAAQSGFVNPGGSGSGSMSNYNDYHQQFMERGGLKVKRIIGNMDDGERAGYITPDPISGDQNLHQKEYREILRTMLGGVDELGIHSGATAFEIRSLFGRAAATASLKAASLFTHGLCELWSLAIQAEENFYRLGLAQRIVMDKKLAKRLEMNSDVVNQLSFMVEQPEQSSAQGVDVYEQLEKSFPDEMIHMMVQEGILQNEPPGLIPYGDRTIGWGWKGPVFENSPREKLNLSIIARNMREDGIKTIESLREQYPDKTDAELKKMLGAYPFRVAGQMLQGLSALLQTQQSVLISPLMQLPDPNNPEVSMGQVYVQRISNLINSNLTSLEEELSYGATYNADSTDFTAIPYGYGTPDRPGTFRPGTASAVQPGSGLGSDPRSLPVSSGDGSIAPNVQYWDGRVPAFIHPGFQPGQYHPGGGQVHPTIPNGSMGQQPTGDIRDFTIPHAGSTVATPDSSGSLNASNSPIGPTSAGPNTIVYPGGPGYLQSTNAASVPPDIAVQPWLFQQLYGNQQPPSQPRRKPKR